MNQLDKTTEEKILDAANKVFVEKGLDGTRMQQIADEANINKSLLHYYYRTKDKLFAEVFKRVINLFLPETIKVFESDKSLFDKIRVFSQEYISFIQRNPVVPNFVLHELNKNPKNLSGIFGDFFHQIKDNQLQKFIKQVNDEIEKGIIKPVSPIQLIVNLLSLCIFPFVASPILKTIFLDNNSKLFDEFIEVRKTEVANFVINSIKL